MNISTENHEIAISALVGSHNYNLNTSKSDRDSKIFVFPTFSDLFHGKRFSSANTSEKLDYTVHDIRSLTEQLWKSNINFIEILFSIEEVHNPCFNFLFLNAESFSTMNLWGFYKSTAGQFKQKMLGLHKGTETTQAMVEEIGYDAKAGSHALRCLLSIERFMRTQSMAETLWFDEGADRNLLVTIKNGQHCESEFMAIIKKKQAEILTPETEMWYSQQPQWDDLKNQLEENIFEIIRERI